MSDITPEHAQAALAKAELLYSSEQIDRALDGLGEAITRELARRDPLVLVVMNGALVAAAHLLGRLRFPLRVGYLHATRYRGDTRGGAMHWVAPPRPDVRGQTVLVVDDILDEGDTLKAILDELRRLGATAVYSAVLVEKRHDRKAPGSTVDFIGLEVPDRYVFGFGMDYHDYWRNLPAIYAVGG